MNLRIYSRSCNDLNNLDRSLLKCILYTVNGKQYSVPYFLADGIYYK
jgi:hypothetical protein